MKNSWLLLSRMIDHQTPQIAANAHVGQIGNGLSAIGNIH